MNLKGDDPSLKYSTAEKFIFLLIFWLFCNGEAAEGGCINLHIRRTRVQVFIFQRGEGVGQGADRGWIRTGYRCEKAMSGYNTVE
jgi:hypothetical protein